MNVAIFSPENVRSFRVALLDVAALRQFRQIARANREKLLAGNHEWQGLAFSLDISTYGRVSQVKDKM